MRIPNARVPQLAGDMCKALLAAKLIESDNPREAQLDLEAVLNQYAREEQEIAEQARDIVSRRGLANSELGRVRRELAKQRGIELGDEAIDYVLGQLLEMLMNSQNIDEIFGEDFQLKRLMREPLRKLAATEASVDDAVKRQLKHVQEGTSTWEVEYQRLKEDVKRRKGL